MIKVKTLRPFNSVTELVLYYEKEVIWLKCINSGIRYMITAINFTTDEVYLSGTGRWYTMENLMYDFTFAGDAPCGVYEWKEEK